MYTKQVTLEIYLPRLLKVGIWMSPVATSSIKNL